MKRILPGALIVAGNSMVGAALGGNNGFLAGLGLGILLVSLIEYIRASC